MSHNKSQSPSKAIRLESLEPRQFLSSTQAALPPMAFDPATAFSVKIDFITEAATFITPGYKADIGRAFGPRRNGGVYGWQGSNEANAKDRDNALSPDDRYDTLNEFVGPGSWWAIVVPNGRYRVKVVMGDPSDVDRYDKLNVEGVLAVDHHPTAEDPWAVGVVDVNVDHGALAIQGAAGGMNNRIDFIEITQIAPLNITWTDATELPARNSRVEPGRVQIGNKLYEFGGYNKGNNQVTRETSVLDFETGQWTLLAPIPPGAAQSHAGVATDGTYIYWAGGQLGGGSDITQLVATENVWRYEIATNTWSRYVNLPRPQLAAGMTIFNGVLYLVGGVEHPELAEATTNHFALNTRSRNPTWIDRAPLPRATDHAGIIEVDGTIYAIGGEHGHGTTYTQHADVYAYNPWEDTWTRKAEMPVASSHFDGSSLVIGKRIVVMGGRTDLPDFTTAQVRVYDIELNQWSVLNSLPFDRLGGFVGVFNDRIFFTNGYSRVQGLAAESFWGTLEGFDVATS